MVTENQLSCLLRKMIVFISYPDIQVNAKYT